MSTGNIYEVDMHVNFLCGPTMYSSGGMVVFTEISVPDLAKMFGILDPKICPDNFFEANIRELNRRDDGTLLVKGCWKDLLDMACNKDEAKNLSATSQGMLVGIDDITEVQPDPTPEFPDRVRVRVRFTNPEFQGIINGQHSFVILVTYYRQNPELIQPDAALRVEFRMGTYTAKQFNDICVAQNSVEKQSATARYNAEQNLEGLKRVFRETQHMKTIDWGKTRKNPLKVDDIAQLFQSILPPVFPLPNGSNRNNALRALANVAKHEDNSRRTRLQSEKLEMFNTYGYPHILKVIPLYNHIATTLLECPGYQHVMEKLNMSLKRGDSLGYLPGIGEIPLITRGIFTPFLWCIRMAIDFLRTTTDRLVWKVDPYEYSRRVIYTTFDRHSATILQVKADNWAKYKDCHVLFQQVLDDVLAQMLEGE